MIQLAAKLWPLNRSLTGRGNVLTLKILKKYYSGLKIKKFKSGTKVFDWTVPLEWNIKDAFIITPNKKKFVTLKKIIFILLDIQKRSKKN